MSIWIDLSDLLQWKGNLTGIQRIQFNISKLYIESGQDVKFFTYHEHSRSFQEIDFRPEDIVKLGIVNDTVNTWDTYRIYRGVLRRVRLLTLEERTRRKVIEGSHRIRRGMHVKTKSPFGPHDVVLVMGSIWMGMFIDDLREAKQQKGFTLVHFAFDMIPSKLPGFVVPWLPEVFIDYHKKAFAISDGILSISKSTAADVNDFMKKHHIHNQPKIEVVRIGESIDDGKEKAVRDLEPGFILSVSTIEARKNHLALLYLVREAQQRGIKLPKVVIVGRNGWHTEDLRYMVHHDPVASKSMRILNNINDAELTWLYRNCRFTVFPSFYEGWGMPIAESLAYGKLCLASNTSSMPEIASDLIDYFSPYDTGALFDLVIKYLDQKRLIKKEKQIKDTYTPTSWDDMYREVAKFINTVHPV